MNTLRTFLALGVLVLTPALAHADPHGKWKNIPGRGSWSSYQNHQWSSDYGRDRGRGFGRWDDRSDDWRNRPSGHWNYGPSRGNPPRGDYAIQQGIRDGRLSRDEVRELRDKERDIRREEAAYWSDGRLSNRERNELQEEYRDYYHDLNHELNDGERRNRDRDWWGW